ncbi:MAG: F0F1 ATP synthase subunit beta, partial [Myxococcales bacterium]|nr:F0F1 ATP synthase subunit beta [Myxococcales bacterium]
MTGVVEAVQGGVVDIRFARGEEPDLREVLRVVGRDDPVLEVQSHPDPGLARALALSSTAGLFRGQAVERTGVQLQVPVGEAVLGRVLDCLGRPLDGGAPVATEERRGVHRAPPPLHLHRGQLEPLWTGIKIVDLLCPFARGGKTGLFGGAGVGK